MAYFATVIVFRPHCSRVAECLFFVSHVAVETLLFSVSCEGKSTDLFFFRVSDGVVSHNQARFNGNSRLEEGNQESALQIASPAG